MLHQHTGEGSSVDIMIIGHLSKDRLVFQDRDQFSSGGSVYYGAIALRQLGLRVAVVTRLHENDFPRLDELKKEGILVFAQAAEQTSCIENIHTTPGSDRRILRPFGFAGPFVVGDVPQVEARVYYVGPIMPGEIDVPFLHNISKRGPLALDVQGMLPSW